MKNDHVDFYDILPSCIVNKCTAVKRERKKDALLPTPLTIAVVNHRIKIVTKNGNKSINNNIY